LFHIIVLNFEKGDGFLKYSEFKDFLKKNPYCFRPLREQKKEFDQKVARAEKRSIVFVESKNNYESQR
jgi:hypothetical protein